MTPSLFFDRIRENNRLAAQKKISPQSSTSPSIKRCREPYLPAGLTFLTVLVLFLMGGQVLRAFSFALVVGIVVGTYSSFGIAAPLVVWWHRLKGQGAAAGTGPAAGNKPGPARPPQGALAPAGRR